MDSAAQRSLHSIQAHDPTTASSAQFCLLCCQPEPVPRSLAARLSQLTSRDPCRLQAWLGRAFCTVCRTCTGSPHSDTIIRSDRESRPSSKKVEGKQRKGKTKQCREGKGREGKGREAKGREGKEGRKEGKVRKQRMKEGGKERRKD